MPDLRGLEQKFIVYKASDVVKAGKTARQLAFNLNREMEAYRKSNGKKEHTYIVINTDEPYAQQVIDIMKAHGHWGKEDEANE